MATEPVIHTEGVHAEIRDTNMPALVILGSAIVITVAIVMLFCWWLFGIYTYVQPLGPAATPFASARPLPPEPRLQPKPESDLQLYLNEESSELDSYGWVDRASGVVRIPVDRAMKLLLQQGLPVRGTAQTVRADAAGTRGIRRRTVSASVAGRGSFSKSSANSAVSGPQLQPRRRR